MANLPGSSQAESKQAPSERQAEHKENYTTMSDDKLATICRENYRTRDEAKKILTLDEIHEEFTAIAQKASVANDERRKRIHDAYTKRFDGQDKKLREQHEQAWKAFDTKYLGKEHGAVAEEEKNALQEAHKKAFEELRLEQRAELEKVDKNRVEDYDRIRAKNEADRDAKEKLKHSKKAYMDAYTELGERRKEQQGRPISHNEFKPTRTPNAAPAASTLRTMSSDDLARLRDDHGEELVREAKRVKVEHTSADTSENASDEYIALERDEDTHSATIIGSSLHIDMSMRPHVLLRKCFFDSSEATFTDLGMLFSPHITWNVHMEETALGFYVIYPSSQNGIDAIWNFWRFFKKSRFRNEKLPMILIIGGRQAAECHGASIGWDESL